MTQPTWDEMKAMLPIKGRYAALAGTGPAGKTCGDCAWLRSTDPQGRGRHPKCGRTNYTHGSATTILKRSPACHRFEEP